MRKHNRRPSIAQELLSLKERTSWSWEGMSNEFERVMNRPGPSNTTLFRYATGRVKRGNLMVERYVHQAISKITVELVEKELRECEEDWREPRSLLRTIIEGTADVVYVQDLEGKYVIINPAGAAALRIPVEDIIGKSDDDLFSPEEAEQLQRENHEVIASEAPLIREVKVSLLGQERVFQTNKSPCRDSDGRIVGVIGVCRDITEVKQAANPRDE